jgi:hypothetical protein
VHTAGYATNPDYADKLIRLIEQHNLTAFDAAQRKEQNTMSERVGSRLATITTLKTTQCNIPRNQPISAITIHHAAGVISGANLQGWGRNLACNASWHYGVGNDGVIGQLIDERNRPWTSSSAANDHRAVTLEVGNSKTAPTWEIGQKAWAAMLDLLVDICRRNPGIKQKNGQPGLYFDGTANASLTIHKFFANTNCPGPFIESRLHEICAEVNKRLGTATPPLSTAPATQSPPTGQITIGSRVRIKAGAKYYTGGDIPAWVINDTWIVHQVTGDRVVINENVSKTRAIKSPIHIHNLILS